MRCGVPVDGTDGQSELLAGDSGGAAGGGEVKRNRRCSGTKLAGETSLNIHNGAYRNAETLRPYSHRRLCQ